MIDKNVMPPITAARGGGLGWPRAKIDRQHPPMNIVFVSGSMNAIPFESPNERRIWVVDPPVNINDCAYCAHYLAQAGMALNQCTHPAVIEGIKSLANGPVSVCIDIARTQGVGKCGPQAEYFWAKPVAS